MSTSTFESLLPSSSDLLETEQKLGMCVCVCVDVWMFGWIDGWAGGWMDGCICDNMRL